MNMIAELSTAPIIIEAEPQDNSHILRSGGCVLESGTCIDDKCISSGRCILRGLMQRQDLQYVESSV